jgi:uncharacterized protein (TIGR03437 family)
MKTLRLMLPLVSCLLGYGKSANLPVYFVQSDATGMACSTLGSARVPHMSASLLELPDGQAIRFENARTGVACTNEEPESRLSVFAGNDPADWRAHLPISRRVRFRSVYPGIDVVYYGNGPHLEYDFEIAAGVSASRIRLSFAKGAAVKMSAEGDLLVSVNGSTLVQHRPRAWQAGRQIAANFVIEKNGKRVRIALGCYDRSQPVIIDPVLAWSTSTNGNGSGVETISADQGGNIWILADFPDSKAVFSHRFGPGGNTRDLMLLKVDPTGSQLLYAVLIGGAGIDFGQGLAVGGDGSAYITGSTTSLDFPVTPGAFQKSFPATSGNAAFVVKVAPQGDALSYSTYLSGTGGASGFAIAVDHAGNAYVTGTAVPPDFPLTKGAWEDGFGVYPLSTPYALREIGGGFVVKLNTTGTALLYSTLVDLAPAALAVNSDGAAYVMGASVAYLPPLTRYTLMVGDPSGAGTVVRRLSPDGSLSDLSIFLGCLTPYFVSGNLIALDGKNNILVAGSSACTTFSAGTNGAFQSRPAPAAAGSLPPRYDGLIVKVASDGSSVLAATFLGGGDQDNIAALALASDGSVVVAGGTSSSDFPVTADALQTTYGGGAVPQAQLPGDGFFARLGPNLDRLLYSTYLGGSGIDSIQAMGLDLADNAYLGGIGGPGSTPGSFSFGGPGNLWALKLARDTAAPPAISSASPGTLTAGSNDSAVQIAGLNFASNALVLVNGVAVPTSMNGATQLTATVSAASLTKTGVLEIRVLNPGSGASNLLSIPVAAPDGVNPNPHIESLLPSGLPAGSPPQSVSVTGSGFLSSTVAAVNGNPRMTTLNADQTLSLSLTNGDLAAAGTLNVTLSNPAPGGGVSNGASFVVAPGLVPLPPPGLASIAPSTRPSGSVDTVIGLTASGLSSSSTARWNGVDHALSRSSSGDLSFTVTAAELAHAGTAEVTVYDPATHLESNPVPFWIPFSATCSDLAWNRANGRLYLSGTNSIVILNPDTGDAEATVPVDIDISRLEISQDGSYLFAAAPGVLRRYQILTGSPWLGNPIDLALQALIDFAPVPGSPGSVAVNTSLGATDEVAIYDGAVKRPATAQIPPATAPRALQFSEDGQSLYYAVGYSTVSVTTMPVTSGGLGNAVTKGNASSLDLPARYSRGRIYTNSGAIYNAATLERVGTIPVSSHAPPLVTADAVVTLATTNQYYCSLQAFDPVSFLPIWEEHMLGACEANYYPYSALYDIGGGRVSFRMTKAYIIRKPTSTPLHSVYPMAAALSATLELGTTWDPDNDVAVLSKQNTLPVTAFLMPDQPGVFNLGPTSSSTNYAISVTPNTFSLSPVNAPAPPGQYSGKVAILLSNSTNAPVLVPYQISVANPYPLQATVSSLAFTWHIGDPAPAAQSFLLTKQGKTIGAGFQGPSFPAWLTVRNGANGPPETITATVTPTGLAAGTYTAAIKMGYYPPTVGSLTVPVTLTVIGNPTVSSVQDAESANRTVAPGEWVAIYGKDLAATTRIWAASDFGSGNALPTNLDGVGVRFGGVAAAVYYVSPTQIDVQVPSGISGDVPVVVSLYGVTSSAFTATIATHSPSLFVYQAGANLYPAAIHLDGTLIGDPAVQPTATKAKAGETIELYVNGLAPSPGGVLIAEPVPYIDPVTVSIGAKQGLVTYAGLVAPGQFQINVQIPPDVAPGHYPIAITAAGQTSPGTVILPVQ